MHAHLRGVGLTSLERATRAYLNHVAVERGLSQNTCLAYERDLRRYLEWSAARRVVDLDEVTDAHVADYVAALRVGDEHYVPQTATSVSRGLISVRGLHKFAVAEGMCADNPAAAVAPPKAPDRLPKALPYSDVERLLQSGGPEDTPEGLRNRALLEILYGTGARVSEAVGLDVDDLDVGERVVLLKGKGGKERLVPLGGYVASAVEAYLVRARPLLALRGKGTPRLLLNARGAPLSRQSAWAVLQEAASSASLEASPHTLRHSFATHLLEGGADIRVVQELLGHASVTTTQIYTRITVDSLREVYAASHPRSMV